MLAQLPERLHTIAIGKPEIHENEVRLVRDGEAGGLGARAGQQHAITEVREQMIADLPRVFVIVDNKDGFWRHAMCCFRTKDYASITAVVWNLGLVAVKSSEATGYKCLPQQLYTVLSDCRGACDRARRLRISCAAMSTIELSEILRRRIVADLHLGRIKPGGRLPSLRMVARELGVSIRVAARAYSELEQEGLVRVRGRSGIYLVLPPSVDVELEEPLKWYAEMLREAWSRRLTIPDINSLLQQLVGTPTRVACVESTSDHMSAFCAELEEDFALKTMSVHLTEGGAVVDGETMTLYDALSKVDFAVTTAFHASEVRLAADLLKKPVVVVSVNETLIETLEQQLANGPITIVAEDHAFVERFRTYLLERFRECGDMRVTSLEHLRGDPAVAADSIALYTRAARQQLNEQEYYLLPPPVAFISNSAARRIVQCMLSTHRDRTLQIA